MFIVRKGLRTVEIEGERQWRTQRRGDSGSLPSLSQGKDQTKSQILQTTPYFAYILTTKRLCCWLLVHKIKEIVIVRLRLQSSNLLVCVRLSWVAVVRLVCSKLDVDPRTETECITCFSILIFSVIQINVFISLLYVQPYVISQDWHLYAQVLLFYTKEDQSKFWFLQVVYTILTSLRLLPMCYYLNSSLA